jgi:hypothetical protein
MLCARQPSRRMPDPPAPTTTPRLLARARVAASLLLLAALTLGAAPARRQADGTPASASDGPAYFITGFELQYIQVHPDHPDLEPVRQRLVTLGRTEAGWVAPRPGVETASRTIADLGGAEGETFFASAVQVVIVTVLQSVQDHDLMGVYVAPHPEDITTTGEDLRPPDRTTLRLVVTTGVVAELRTLASGDRIPAAERVNNPLHERVNNPLHDRIRRNSPIQPYQQGSSAPGDLLEREVLDRYLFHLSRHPGRRVDAAVSAAGASPGSVTLDYLVTENRPLVLYAQVGNTGTQQTDDWRQRFGLLHTQLTNADDVLSLDYITGSFDETNAFIGSYERPFADNDRIRWRVHGAWSEFSADQVGFANAFFTGESWMVGADLVANIHQDRELFVDLVVGARWLDTEVDSPFVGEGHEQFLLPSVGLRLDRTTEWFSTQGLVRLEWQISDVTDVDPDELGRLGRTDPDEDWVVLHGALRHSVFLEPLFDREAWEDPSTPDTSTLAHELMFVLRGQYAFDNRLIAQLQQVAGGLHSVRGYRQSLVAGDSAIIGTIEYRYHLPRAFAVEAEPREVFGEPFRLAPQHVFGLPDWDLIFKGFLDVGRTFISDRLSFEDDETLIGAGVGLELIYRRNLNLRVDWGFALEDVDSTDTDAGSSRVHFVGTILF